MEFRRHPERAFAHLLIVPFVYVLIVPFVLLDVLIELYHRISFPIYRYPYIKRSQYIRIDRHRLEYLNFMEKLNCLYCSYANGLLPYAAAIAAASERYWCSIMHKNHPEMKGQDHQKDFLPYGDKKAFDAFVKKNDLSK